MPTINNNILCVTVPELVACGVSESVIKDALYQQRKGLVYCWEHHKVGKTVYIHYNALKDTYKALIKAVHCEGVEPELYLKNLEASKLNNELLNLCDSLSNMIEVSPDEVAILTQRGLYTAEDVQRIARSAGWLRLWRKMDVKTARKHGFVYVKEVQNEVFKRCLNEQTQGFVKFPKPINNERVLDRKAREYATNGLDALIGGYFGNVNREMIDGKVHALLMDMMCNPVKSSFEDIGLIYNSTAIEQGLPKMTVSAIKQHLNKPTNKKIWSYSRHGKHEADLVHLPQIQRDAVSRADALWSLDGTATQLYYRDENGTIKSDLYVYFVTDVYSSAIIGYSIAFSESMGMVAEALKMAIDTYGYKPYQLQYDNSSANTCGAIQGVMTNMSHVHFGCKPYWGQSKYVESYIGHFQQRVLRKAEFFKGGNIASSSLNSKANPELLKKFKKNPELLLSESELRTQFAGAVKEWNDRGEKRNSYGEFVGESKLTRYLHPHADREQLNYFEKISLFMSPLKTPYKYGLQGITIKLGKTTRKYIVPDTDGIGDWAFGDMHRHTEFDVRINVLSPDFITLYKNKKLIATAHEAEKYASCVADMKNKPNDAVKIKQFLAKQEQYGYDYAIAEIEKQREILFKHDLKTTGTGGFDWYDIPKSEFNDLQNKQEDYRNGMTDESPEQIKINALHNW